MVVVGKKCQGKVNRMLEDLETRENKEGSRNRMKFSLIKTTKVDSVIKFENVTEVKKF